MGQGDLVSRLIMGMSRVAIGIIGVIDLAFFSSPSSSSRIH